MDENLPAEIAGDLRSAGHSADSVTEEKRSGAADAEILEVSRAEQRILLTLDKGIANLIRYPKHAHAGVVLFRPGSNGRRAVLRFVRSRLHQILELDLTNRLTVVTEKRIRIR